jgi:hypothetical protein
MAYRVKQFRYYNDESSTTDRNQPSRYEGNTPITYAHYVNGDVFGTCYPILQLGIQALPGTKFYLNDSAEPIIIGQTGIYELDLTNGIQITQLQIDARSITSIRDNQNAYLIVDILYDDGEA